MTKKAAFGFGLIAVILAFVSCELFTIDDVEEYEKEGYHIPKICVAWQENLEGYPFNNNYVKCQDAYGYWLQLGEYSLNVNKLDFSSKPSIALDEDSVPYAAWTEGTGTPGDAYVYVKRWNEDDEVWELVGDDMHIEFPITKSLKNVLGISALGDAVISIGRDDSIAVAFVQYNEYNRLFVKIWNGEDWELLGDEEGLNLFGNDAYDISFALFDDELGYLAWREYDPVADQYKVLVKKGTYDTGWDQLGDALNTTDQDGSDPFVVVNDDGVPFVSFKQYSTLIGGYEIFVRYWNEDASAWETLAGSLALDPMMVDFNADLTLDHDNMPYAMWSENYFYYVKRWDGSTWNIVGEEGTGPVNDDNTYSIWYGGGGLAITDPTPGFPEGILAATWSQSNEAYIYQVWTSYWDGEKWQKSESMNIDETLDGTDSNIAAK